MNRVTISVFVVCAVLFLLLQYIHADTRLTGFIGGILIGIIISIVGGWISKLFKKKKTS